MQRARISLLLLLLLLLYVHLPVTLAASAYTDNLVAPHWRSQALDFSVGCRPSLHTQAAQSQRGHRPDANVTFDVNHRGAQFLVFHFAFAQLAPSMSIEILDLDGYAPASAQRNGRLHLDTQEQHPRVLQHYTHTSIPALDFFTPPLFANHVAIRYTTTATSTSRSDSSTATAIDTTSEHADITTCFGFRIDEYRFGATTSTTKRSKAKAAAVDGDTCTTVAAESTDAACLAFDPDVVEAARPVARLLIQKPLGAIFCTGWLLGCEGHVLTNHHCVSQESEANATSIEFMAQGATCAQQCDSPTLCPGHVVAASAQIVAFSPETEFDYVLLLPRLSATQLQAIVADYGFLSLRAGDAVVDEQIFIPQHPAGCGKRVALKYDASYGSVESLSEPSCNTRSDNIGYRLDTRGGSSGAPVIASDDKSVIGLHYCKGGFYCCCSMSLRSMWLDSHSRQRPMLGSITLDIVRVNQAVGTLRFQLGRSCVVLRQQARFLRVQSLSCSGHHQHLLELTGEYE